MVGVSPDPVEKLAKFAAAEELTFPLLSDEDHAVAEAYGAWGEKKNYGKTYQGLIRSTIVVDPDGKVSLAQYNVRATGPRCQAAAGPEARRLTAGTGRCACAPLQWKLASAVVGVF